MHKVRVKSLAILFLVALLVLCVGCEKGSYSIKSGKITHDGNTYSGKYKKFEGDIEYPLGKRKEVTFNYSVITKSGKLTFSLLDADKNTLTSFDKIDKGKMSKIFDKETGLYLKIEGKNHEGSFDLTVVD